MILARLQPREASERRVAPRRQLKLDVVGTVRSVGDIEVAVHDLSATGLLIEAAADLQVGDRLEVAIDGASAAEAVVVWTSGRFFGCEFPRTLSKSALSAAELRSAPQRPPMAQADSAPAQNFQLEQRPRLEFDFTPSNQTVPDEATRPDPDLSPGNKLLILLGLSLTGWALVALMVWLILALI